MVKKNLVLIGCSSEISLNFDSLLDKKKYNSYGITSSKIKNLSFTEVLTVNDYLDSILRFLENKQNLTIIFFNGFLAENRDSQFPSITEILDTDRINFAVPYILADSFNRKLKNTSNYVFISSIAAASPRYKNYIYGLSKYKLEESIKNINLPSYLIIRFGKVKTKMSESHKNPPFTISTHKASEFILDNLNKSGYIYTNATLKVIAAILKLLPHWIIKSLKY
jgi:short-subunit dehydrogenase